MFLCRQCAGGIFTKRLYKTGELLNVIAAPALYILMIIIDHICLKYKYIFGNNNFLIILMGVD